MKGWGAVPFSLMFTGEKLHRREYYTETSEIDHGLARMIYKYSETLYRTYLTTGAFLIILGVALFVVFGIRIFAGAPVIHYLIFLTGIISTFILGMPSLVKGLKYTTICYEIDSNGITILNRYGLRVTIHWQEILGVREGRDSITLLTRHGREIIYKNLKNYSEFYEIFEKHARKRELIPSDKEAAKAAGKSPRMGKTIPEAATKADSTTMTADSAAPSAAAPSTAASKAPSKAAPTAPSTATGAVSSKTNGAAREASPAERPPGFRKRPGIPVPKAAPLPPKVDAIPPPAANHHQKPGGVTFREDFFPDQTARKSERQQAPPESRKRPGDEQRVTKIMKPDQEASRPEARAPMISKAPEPLPEIKKEF